MSKKKIAYARRTLLDPEEEDEPLPFEPRNIVVHNDYWVNRDYTLLDVIGRGKFGEVRKCKETATGRMLAAKTIVCRNKEQLDSALREIEMMTTLRHPKVLMLYDAFQNGKAVCIVTELIEGGELFDKIVDSNFNLTERVAILFMRQIVDGVAYIHSQNVIHLDLKPENIICVSKTSTRVKIIDFGLALKYNKSTPQRALAGTVDFMSPEVVNYEVVSPASDMWSVGVICYVLVSGLSPFVGQSDAETLCNITRCAFDYDEEEFLEITDSCKDFINKLIVKDPRKRLTATEAFNHSWLQKITRAQTMKHLSKKHHLKFFARRKWHKAVAAIIAINRLERLGRSHTAVMAEIASRLASERQQQQQQDRAPILSGRKGVVLPPLRNAGVLTPGFKSPPSGDSQKQKFEFEKPSESAPSPSGAHSPAVSSTERPGAKQPVSAANEADAVTVAARHSHTSHPADGSGQRAVSSAVASGLRAVEEKPATADRAAAPVERRAAGSEKPALIPAGDAGSPTGASPGASRADDGLSRAARGSGGGGSAAARRPLELGSPSGGGGAAAARRHLESDSLPDAGVARRSLGSGRSPVIERPSAGTPKSEEGPSQPTPPQQQHAESDSVRRISADRRKFEPLGSGESATVTTPRGSAGGIGVSERPSPTSAAASVENGEVTSPEAIPERRRSNDRTSGHRTPRGGERDGEATTTTTPPSSGSARSHGGSSSGSSSIARAAEREDGRRSERDGSNHSPSPRTASGPLTAEERRRRIAAILNDDEDYLSKPPSSTGSLPRTSALDGVRTNIFSPSMPKHEVQRLERLRKILETS